MNTYEHFNNLLTQEERNALAVVMKMVKRFHSVPNSDTNFIFSNSGLTIENPRIEFRITKEEIEKNSEETISRDLHNRTITGSILNVSLYEFLDNTSERVGELITEYSWRETCGLMKGLEDDGYIKVKPLK